MAFEVESTSVEVTVKDGTKMSIYMSTPKGSKKGPGIIVLQEAFGVNSHIQDMTKRFAKLGFTAAAPELFHRTGAHVDGDYNDFASIMPHYQALTQATLSHDLTATHSWLTSQATVDNDKIAAIGYCMGGRTAFLANAVLPLKAAVSYYGGRIAPDLLPLAAKMHGAILFFWGGLDKHIPGEQISAVTGALQKEKKRYVNVEFSYADHAFSNDERPSSYSETATREAWAMTIAFFENNLGYPLST